MNQTSRQGGQPVRFAVIGCGMHAQMVHLPNIVASPRMVLQVCCDLSPQTLETCEAKFKPVRISQDFDEVIRSDDVDAICLASTEKLRLPVIRIAAEVGKPVYVEKPLARTLEEVYEIQRVVNGAGIAFCVGHNRRASPAMIYAHRIFRDHMENPKPCPWRFDREGQARPTMPGDGVAGMSVRINDDWWSWKGWVFDREQAPHGPMLFEMTHFTDLCNWFLAAEPQRVIAMENDMFHTGVTIGYATGEMATISMTANGTFGYPKELYEVMGHGGIVAIDHMLEVRTAGITDVSPRKTFDMLGDRHPDVGGQGGFEGWFAKKQIACEEAARAGDTSLLFTAEPDRGHARFLEHFVDEIHGLSEPICPVDDAVRATRVAFAAIKSAGEGRMVDLDEI